MAKKQDKAKVVSFVELGTIPVDAGMLLISSPETLFQGNKCADGVRRIVKKGWNWLIDQICKDREKTNVAQAQVLVEAESGETIAILPQVHEDGLFHVYATYNDDSSLDRITIIPGTFDDATPAKINNVKI